MPSFSVTLDSCKRNLREILKGATKGIKLKSGKLKELKFFHFPRREIPNMAVMNIYLVMREGFASRKDS